MTVDCYIGFDATTVPDIPDLKQRGSEARDNNCNKLDAMQAQSVTDSDTGLALLLRLALPLEVEVQTQIKAEAEARVTVDTNTFCGLVAQQCFEGCLSDTPKWFLGGFHLVTIGK